jgi:PAS domain S-box-containing protein
MKTAFKIVLIYVITGLVWSHFSDLLLLWIDPSGDLKASTHILLLKDLVFIFITAIILFFLIRRQNISIERNAEALNVQNAIHRSTLVEARFKAFALHGNDMITMFDENNKRFYCSPNIERILGYSIDEFTNSEAFALNHPDDTEMTNKLKTSTIENPGKSFPFQWRVKHKNGHWVWIEGSIINLLHVKDVKAIISNFRDVTEHKSIQQRLRQHDDSLYLSNERFRLVSKATRDTIWDCDLATDDIVWNLGLATNFGYADKAVNYNTQWWLSCVHPDDADRVMTKLDQFVALRKEIWEDEYRFRDVKGNYRYVLDKGFISYDSLNEPQRMIGAMQDITALKQSERSLKQMNAELNENAARLALSNEELERFAYVASHDLQEPLRMVSSFLFLLEKKFENELDDTARQYIHFAVDASERMKKLILDLLEYSKVSGSLQEPFVDVDINEVLQTVSETFKSTGQDQNIEIMYSPMPVIKANKTQIFQLFQNLIGNAIKYSKRDIDPKIQIVYTETDDEWVFEVKDNGIGIKEEYFDEIFVIFKRLHGRSEYSGTGIGLATCKKIVESHKGRIWAESKYGFGSSFKFTIKK